MRPAARKPNRGTARPRGRRPPPLAFFAAELAAGRLTQSPLHARRYQETLDALAAFAPRLAWADFAQGWAHAFDAFLATARGCRAESTRAGYHKRVRRMLRAAAGAGLLGAGQDPYLTARFPRGKSRRTGLTEAEVARLEALRLPPARGGEFAVRDMFLFSCYCGLRFGDVRRVRAEHLDAAGVLRLRMGKVDRAIALPLRALFHGRPLAILSRYLVAGSAAPCFPPYSNAYVNATLKRLAAAAGIERRLTFHMARHTFGTRLAERVRDPFVILALMGHASVRTSMHYIHQSAASIEARLEGVEW